MRIIAFVLGTALCCLPLASVAQTGGGAAVSREVTLRRIVVDLKRGDRWGQTYSGIGWCGEYETLVWESGREEMKTDNFEPLFVEEMRKSGVKVAGNGDNLFEERTAAELEVGVRIKSMDHRPCWGGLGWASYKGSSKMAVEWQVYSRLEGRVIATVQTTGATEQKTLLVGDHVDMLMKAFSDNARQFAGAGDFRTALAGRSRTAGESIAVGAREPINLSNGSGAVMPVSDAVGSVVAVLTGDGHGSAFLVSEDGHLLTNQHVVGDARQVKLRWSDGMETVGEVIRSDKRRDVALIKSDSRGRQPLKVRTASAQPGESVLAIGTPIDPQYQNSVTRGVVSGNRILEGFSYLQSDVAVNPGNSGGPLLDEKAQVVAITVMMDTRGDSLNFFIPIRDALDFLSLKVQ